VGAAQRPLAPCPRRLAHRRLGPVHSGGDELTVGFHPFAGPGASAHEVLAAIRTVRVTVRITWTSRWRRSSAARSPRTSPPATHRRRGPPPAPLRAGPRAVGEPRT